MALKVEVLVSVGGFLIDFELGCPIGESVDVHVQYWQMLFAVFVFTVNWMLGLRLLRWSVKSLTLSLCMALTTSSTYLNQMDGLTSGGQHSKASI